MVPGVATRTEKIASGRRTIDNFPIGNPRHYQRCRASLHHLAQQGIGFALVCTGLATGRNIGLSEDKTAAARRPHGKLEHSRITHFDYQWRQGRFVWLKAAFHPLQAFACGWCDCSARDHFDQKPVPFKPW